MKANEHLRNLLNSKDVFIVDKKNVDLHIKYDEKKCLEHIENIVDIQQKFLECEEPFALGITSNIWNEVEELKVWNRRAQYILEKSNVLELQPIINRATSSIEILYDLDYVTLIKRAMNRNEICLGKPYESNLFREDKLKIVDISKVNFNLIEHDCYKYLSRIKRKGVELHWTNLIEYFLKKHGLGSESERYIVALLSYPYEPMKFIQQYYFKGIVDKEEFLNKLNEINGCF